MSAAAIGAAVLEAIMSRRSVGALTEPGPRAEILEQILAAATTGPDHGSLQPYRFVVIDATSRERFGHALATDTDRARGGISAELADKFRKKAQAAPVMVLIIFSPVESTKAPEWEQLVAASSTGYPILLAAAALGVGAAWRSAAVLDGEAMTALCQLRPGERVLGWINLGTPAVAEVRERAPASLDGKVLRP